MSTPAPGSTLIAYKVLTGDQMAQLEKEGTFTGAPVDVEDGYIHLSTAEQLDETVSKHFAGQGNFFSRLAVQVERFGGGIQHDAAIFTAANVAFDFLAKFWAEAAVHIIRNGGEQFLASERVGVSHIKIPRGHAHQNSWRVFRAVEAARARDGF